MKIRTKLMVGMLFVVFAFNNLFADSLIWQDEAINKNTTMTHKQASEYCKNLRLYEVDDWHLPSMDEFDEVYTRTTTKTSKFGNIKRDVKHHHKFKYLNANGDYWSSDTTWRNFGYWAYFLHIKSYAYFYGDKKLKKNFRCVRNSVF